MTQFDSFAGSKTRHGTASGFRKHQELEEPVCPACRLAKAKYDRERLGQPEMTLRNRATAKAQVKAYGELARRHYDEYRELYEAYRDEVYAELGLEKRVKGS